MEINTKKYQEIIQYLKPYVDEIIQSKKNPSLLELSKAFKKITWGDLKQSIPKKSDIRFAIIIKVIKELGYDHNLKNKNRGIKKILKRKSNFSYSFKNTPSTPNSKKRKNKKERKIQKIVLDPAAYKKKSRKNSDLKDKQTNATVKPQKIIKQLPKLKLFKFPHPIKKIFNNIADYSIKQLFSKSKDFFYSNFSNYTPKTINEAIDFQKKMKTSYFDFSSFIKLKYLPDANIYKLLLSNSTKELLESNNLIEIKSIFSLKPPDLFKLPEMTVNKVIEIIRARIIYFWQYHHSGELYNKFPKLQSSDVYDNLYVMSSWTETQICFKLNQQKDISDDETPYPKKIDFDILLTLLKRTFNSLPISEYLNKFLPDNDFFYSEEVYNKLPDYYSKKDLELTLQHSPEYIETNYGEYIHIEEAPHQLYFDSKYSFDKNNYYPQKSDSIKDVFSSKHFDYKFHQHNSYLSDEAIYANKWQRYYQKPNRSYKKHSREIILKKIKEVFLNKNKPLKATKLKKIIDDNISFERLISLLNEDDNFTEIKPGMYKYTYKTEVKDFTEIMDVIFKDD